MNAPEPIQRLSRDVLSAARALTDSEARFLVDTYYIMQEDRKRAVNQERALDESNEPNRILAWLADQAGTLEKQVKRALESYTDAHPVGAWMKSVTGIGPVISAGLLAHIDIEQAPTVGHIWRYAGLDPTAKWVKAEEVEKRVREVVKTGLTEEAVVALATEFGRSPSKLLLLVDRDGRPDAKAIETVLKRRPWNASLKVLQWKAGQCFMKFSNHPACYYGHLYKERKAYEIQRNEAGGNAAAAAAGAARVGKSTDAFGHYSNGKLPPAQIDARARRYAVKQFLADLHGEWYRIHFGKEPPLPYPIAIQGHAHLRVPPVFAADPAARDDMVRR